LSTIFGVFFVNGSVADYPDGVATSSTYDTLNRLTNMQSLCGTPGSAAGSTGALASGASGTPISSYACTLGAAGNRLSVAELSGRTVNYGYDGLYRLTSETVASDPHGNNGQVSYTFDNVGNRLQRTSTLPAVVTTGLLNYDATTPTTAPQPIPTMPTVTCSRAAPEPTSTTSRTASSRPAESSWSTTATATA
jgi:YD repeat-containing protein